MSLKTEILRRYRGYIMLNKNIFIAGVCAFIASAAVAEVYHAMDNNAAINSTLSVAIEYSIYIPLLAYLYYRDNRWRYRSERSVIWSNVLSDAKKLTATLVVAEIAYTAVRGYVHYHSLNIGLQPYQAALFSSIAASILFYTVVNVGAKVTRLFK